MNWQEGGFCEEGSVLQGPEGSEEQTWSPLKQMCTGRASASPDLGTQFKRMNCFFLEFST